MASRKPAASVIPRFGQVACQFAWYNADRAYQGANLKTSATATHRVAPIDFDGARIPDPSHPEDRAALAFAFDRTGQPAAVALESQAAIRQYFDGTWGDWVQVSASAAATTGRADLGYGGADPAVGAAGGWHAGAIHLLVAQGDGTHTHVSHPSGDMADPAGCTIRGAIPSLGSLVRPMGIRLGLAITVFDANTVDVMLPNFDGEIVVRRLTVSAPVLTMTGAWTSML